MRSNHSVVLAVACIGLLISQVWSGHASASPSRAGAASALLHPRSARHVHLPLAFEPNRGQSANRVRFLARGQGYTLFLTQHSANLSLFSASTPPRRRVRSRSIAAGKPTVTALGTVQLRFVGEVSTTVVRGRQRLPGRVNYFVGNNPAHWRRDIPTYGSVVYSQVYPGIGLRFYGSPGRLEYDWNLQPGADPGRIRVAMSGIDSLALDSHGALVMRRGSAMLSQAAPRVYQVVRGTKRFISAQYAINPNQTYSIHLGSYDHRQSLTIDPVVRYATYLGGLTDANAVALDAAGNTYVTGDTYTAQFPGHGIAQAGVHEGGDTYVAKLNAAGNGLVYATYLGGTDARSHLPNIPDGMTTCAPTAQFCLDVSKSDLAEGIAVGSDGSAVVTGETRSEDFPTLHAVQSRFGGGLCPEGKDSVGHRLIVYCYDAYVTGLNPNGDGFIYSTFLGGNNDDEGAAVALDSSGNAVITGQTRSDGFPLKNSLQSTRPGLGCISGSFVGESLAPTPGAPEACADAFVTKLAPDGSFVFSTFLGGENEDNGTSVAAGSDGSIYVAGVTSSLDFPIRSALPAMHGDPQGTAFVSKLSPDGQHLLYSTFFGGTKDYVPEPTDTAGPTPTDVPESTSDTPVPLPTDAPPEIGATTASGIAVDSAGDTFITGSTASDSLPTLNAVQAHLQDNSVDAFVAELNPTGTGLVYATYLGGSGFDEGTGIAVDYAGEAFVVGSTESVDFPVVGSLQPAPQATAECADPLADGEAAGICSDVFVTKLAPGGTSLVYSTYIGGPDIDQGRAIAVDDSGNASVAGYTFSPQLAGSSYLPGQSATDLGDSGFVVKIYDPPPPKPTPTATATLVPPTPTATSTSTPTATSTSTPKPTKKARKLKKLKKCAKGHKRVKGKCKKRS